MPRRSSNNYRLLRTITSKMRQLDPSREAQYLIIYSFLYKYCSDNLKDHFEEQCAKKSVEVWKAFSDEYIYDSLKKDALDKFGFSMKSPDALIETVMDKYYSEQHFLHAFFTVFRDNVVFKSDSKYSEYFEFIFTEVGHAVNFNKYEFADPSHLIVKEIVYAISKLDVFEPCFPFVKVFERICQSKIIRTDHDPDYLNYLISSIVSSNIGHPENVCIPFLNDASLPINLFSEWGVSWSWTYARCHDSISYCCGIINLMMNGFDMDTVYSEFKSPFEPDENPSVKFDVIMSRLPPITARNLKKFNLSNSYEIAKRNNRKEVQALLSNQLNIDRESFGSEAEYEMLIENLIDKMDLNLDIDSQLVGEYEVLKSSEYLFLINLLNSLNDDGVMVLAMSQSFLVKNSLETLRKYLTFEKNYIDAIISIPDELSRPSRMEIIVVFRKRRFTDEIVFIDMSQDYTIRRAPYAVPGMFVRNLILDEKTINNVLDVYANQKVVDKFSNVVRLSEIKNNGYNLSISRYVDTFEGEFIKLENLKKEKDEIDENIKKLNEKIDLMMEELGFRM